MNCVVSMAEPSSDSNSVRTLNDLPEHLLLHILSFLPIREAVQTTPLISRRWRNLWSYISSLDFDYFLFPQFDSLSKTRQLFAEFVNRILILRSHSHLLKFRLRFDYGEQHHLPYIESWLRYAINHNVIELDLQFYNMGGDDDDDEDEDEDEDYDDDSYCHYEFHLSVLRNSCIRVLRLFYCDLILPINSSATDFLSLQSITLYDIFMTDGILSNLISRSVNLESLVLYGCWGMKDLRICSPKLKELELRLFGDERRAESSVEICAPSLRVIRFDRCIAGKYSLQASSALVEVHVDFYPKMDDYYKFWSEIVRLLSGVKCLIVQNWWFKFLATKDVLADGFVLNHLNHVELRTGYTTHYMLGIALLLEVSPNVNKMILVYDDKLDTEESLPDESLNEPIHLSLPSLRQVKMKYFMGSDDELHLLMLLKKHGVVLEKIELVPAEVDEASIVLSRPFQISEVLEGSPHSEVS